MNVLDGNECIGREAQYPRFDNGAVFLKANERKGVIRKIWTIGHSTRALDEFLELLKGHTINLLVDIRTFPGSRRYPHFNKELLGTSLKQDGVDYLHIPSLGGRRKPAPDSTNTSWRNASFRGYADYMKTPEFRTAATQLENLATAHRVAYMCSEAMWWKCHRALVSDYLKVRGWTVLHIIDVNKVTEHPYTSPARTEQGELFY
jgi:uncharacterized protein (DUF488 family)